MGKFNSCYSTLRQAAILAISILISYQPSPSYSNFYHCEAETGLVVYHPKLQSLAPLMDDFQTSFSN